MPSYDFTQNVQVVPEVKESNISLFSLVALDDVKCFDFTPQDPETRDLFKYYCPICLRYFKTILVGDCCDNYICHKCVQDLKNQEVKNKDFSAACPYGCMHDEDGKL